MNPGQQKISQFQPVESTRANDIIPIVREGQNRSITIGKFTGVLPSGWTTPAENWTYSNFDNGIAAITVPEGDIRRYPNGLRVQFKQGTPPTTRFGIVVASTSTMVYLYMINGTTLENLEIHDIFVSPDFAPGTDEGVDFLSAVPTRTTAAEVGVLRGTYTRHGNLVICDLKTTATFPTGQTAINNVVPQGYGVSQAQGSALMVLGGWNNRILKGIATARFFTDRRVEYVSNNAFNEWYGTTTWVTDDPFPVQ